MVVDHSTETNVLKSFARQYVYDGQQILAEYDGDGNVLAHHTHSSLGMDDALAVEINPAGVDQGLAQASGVYTYLKDSLGSGVDLTDTSDNRVQHSVHSVYGALLAIQNGTGQDVTATPPVRTSYGFTGRELDSEPRLMYYRARYYDPVIGRFLQKDPEPGKLALSPSVVNSYIYCLNNSTNRIDPQGRFSFLGIVGNIVKVIVGISLMVSAAGMEGFLLPFLTFGLGATLIASGVTGHTLSDVIGRFIGVAAAASSTVAGASLALIAGGKDPKPNSTDDVPVEEDYPDYWDTGPAGPPAQGPPTVGPQILGRTNVRDATI